MTKYVGPHFPLTHYIANNSDANILSKDPTGVTPIHEWNSFETEVKLAIIFSVVQEENHLHISPNYPLALYKIEQLIPKDIKYAIFKETIQIAQIDPGFKKLLEDAEKVSDRFKFTFKEGDPVYLLNFSMSALAFKSPNFARINQERFKEHTSKEMFVSSLDRLKFIKYLEHTLKPKKISIEETQEYIESFALFYSFPLTPPMVDVILENINSIDISQPEIIALFMNSDPRLFNAILERLPTEVLSKYKDVIKTLIEKSGFSFSSGKSILKALNANVEIDFSKLKMTELYFYRSDITEAQLNLFKNNPHLKKLTLLECDQIKKIDLNGFESLTHLSINSYSLTSIDLRPVPNLQHLHLITPYLAAIDLRLVPQLQYLRLVGGKLTAIDLSPVPLLQHLDLGAHDPHHY